MPFVLSFFLACHHLPELSRMSRISPLVNEISLGSSGDAESVFDDDEVKRGQAASALHPRHMSEKS